MSIFKEEFGLAAMLAGLCVLGMVFLGMEWMLLEHSAGKVSERLDQPADSALEPDILSTNDFLMKPKQSYIHSKWSALYLFRDVGQSLINPMMIK